MVNRTIHLGKTPLASAYAGPGDVAGLSGVIFWGGLRAYNTAYATGSNPAIDLGTDGGGTSGVSVNILSTGFLDTTSAQTLITAGKSKVVKIWDQSGQGRHFAKAQTGVTLSIVGGVPVMTFDGSNWLDGPSLTQAQPFVVSAVVNPTGAGNIIYFGSAGDSTTFGYRSASGLMYEFAGVAEAGPTSITASALHAVQNILNGVSSNTYVDGTDSLITPFSPGTAGFSSALMFGANGAGGIWVGDIKEIGIWGGMTDTTFPKALMNANQHGTSGWNF